MSELLERLRLMAKCDVPVGPLEEYRNAATEAADRIEQLEAALSFYRDAWEQDVDAERTASGWEGSVGELEPAFELLTDKGEIARAALRSRQSTGERE